MMGPHQFKNRNRPDVDRQWAEDEWAKVCPEDPSDAKPWMNVAACGYFIDEYVQILDRESKKWIPFKLWPKQFEVLEEVLSHGRTAVLKGRRVGATLLLGKAVSLWKVVTYPGMAISLQSVDVAAAKKILTDMRAMFKKLPWWMTEDKAGLVINNSAELWAFSDGTEVRALSTDQGDSYEFNYGVIDEASLVPDLDGLLERIEPTLESVPNSQLVALSRANKREQDNHFTKLYLTGKSNVESGDVLQWTDWRSMFLSWKTNPMWTVDYIEGKRKAAIKKDGHTDSFDVTYPETDVQAIKPSTADKRIMGDWVMTCYHEQDPIEYGGHLVENLRHVKSCRIYHMPKKGKRYIIGVDSAKGLPKSNNSVIIAAEYETGLECATWVGLHGMRDIAHDAHCLSVFYNLAPILVERNNHGEAVIIKLEDIDAYIMDGADDQPGFNSGRQSKILLYDTLAEFFREHFDNYRKAKKRQEERNGPAPKKPVLLHSYDVVYEILGIESNTNKAAPGMKDDRADAYALCIIGRTLDLVEGVEIADYMRF